MSERLHVIGGHAVKPLAPNIDRLLAEFMLLGHLDHRAAVVSFAQDSHHLLFGKSTLFICSLVVEGDSISSFAWSEKSRAGQACPCQ